jgi:hypothetical protein
MFNFVLSAAGKNINNIVCSVRLESCYFDPFRNLLTVIKY